MNYACTKCNITKDVSEFYKDSSRPKGICSWCKPCKNKARSDQYYNNHEYELLRYQTRNTSAEGKAYAAAHYLENKDKYQKMRRERYLRQKEDISVKAKLDRIKRPDYYKARWQKHYAKNQKAYSLKSQERRRDLRRRSLNDICLQEVRTFYRNCPVGYEVDHIMPIKGTNLSGLHVLWNLQYLSVKANRQKSNHINEELLGSKYPCCLMREYT